MRTAKHSLALRVVGKEAAKRISQIWRQMSLHSLQLPSFFTISIRRK